jgi:plastin-1
LAVPDTVDERALNTRPSMNVYQKTENQNLAINAAKSIGCQVTNIGAGDLIEARVSTQPRAF